MAPPNSDVVVLKGDSIVPKTVTLYGKHVVLHPMQLDHLPRLFETMSGEGTHSMYDYTRYGPFEEFNSFRDFWGEALAAGATLFSIENIETGKLEGGGDVTHTFLASGDLEIGFMFSPSMQKTVRATESFYLLANKAFEVGCRRLVWKCDNAHHGSKRAAVRFGFTLEAVFRQHQIVHGHNRDSAFFSLLDKEWPSRKAALEKWMDPSNFDESGRQKNDLRHFQDWL